MNSISDLVTKEAAIQNNRDPRGIKWGIGKVIGTALYHVDILEGNKNSSIPDNLKGKFTNPTLAQKEIEKYLNDAWEFSDRQAQKLARKEHKENIKEDE